MQGVRRVHSDEMKWHKQAFAKKNSGSFQAVTTGVTTATAVFDAMDCSMDPQSCLRPWAKMKRINFLVRCKSCGWGEYPATETPPTIQRPDAVNVAQSDGLPRPITWPSLNDLEAETAEP